MISSLKEIDGINGFSHITGGGLISNTKRVLPEGLDLDIDWKSWDRPEIFKLIQETGNVPEEDMRRTFNLGIGLVAIVSPDTIDELNEKAYLIDEEPAEIGRVV